LSETPPPSAPAPAPAPTPAPAARRTLGCAGRFISALLVIVITTTLTLTAVGYAALTLGFTPQTSAAIGDAQARVATLEAENSALRAQSIEVQTQVSGIIRQSGDDREQVDALREEMASFSQISDVVATRLTNDGREQATIVAEIRASRDVVTTFATVEADRSALLDELRRRSERVERFLLRLSDIAEDTALDISELTATVAPTDLPALPTESLALTASPTPTETLTPTASPTPTATGAMTATPSARPTAAPTTEPTSATPAPRP
jgi:Tfp pilus assembly protein PilN